MRLVVDTGVFSASLSRRRRQMFDRHVNALAGNQLFLSVATVAELRYGAIVADWGSPRREQIEVAIATTTVVPVTDALLSTMAEPSAACRRTGHALADRIHSNDLWIAASAVHITTALVTADGILPAFLASFSSRRRRPRLRRPHRACRCSCMNRAWAEGGAADQQVSARAVDMSRKRDEAC